MLQHKSARSSNWLRANIHINDLTRAAQYGPQCLGIDTWAAIVHLRPVVDVDVERNSNLLVLYFCRHMVLGVLRYPVSLKRRLLLRTFTTVGRSFAT
jgi:hypothetical protein